jgi:hypothetical protein
MVNGRTNIAPAARVLRHLPAMLLVSLLAAAVLVGCSERPAEPVWDNPFDPDNPSSVDPFMVSATQFNGTVTIQWTPLDGFGLVIYKIEHSTDRQTWREIGRDPAAASVGTFTHQDPVPTATNYYLVIGVDADSVETITSETVPASIVVPPVIANAANTNIVRSRYQDLTVFATQGDDVEVSLADGFADATSLARDPGGATVFAAFDLGETDSNGIQIPVFARTVSLFNGLPIYSETGIKYFKVDIKPTIGLPGSRLTIADVMVDVELSNDGDGVDAVRFSGKIDEEGTEYQPLTDWLPGAAVVTDVPVLDTVKRQLLKAEFRSDFGGITTEDTMGIRADRLTSADFRILFPEDNRILTDSLVTLDHTATALEMRVSQFPDFHDSGWTAYSDTSQIQIRPSPGQFVYLIYAQYRNHWFDSAIRADWFILGDGQVPVSFLNPVDGQIVEGGTTIEVAGTADTFDDSFPLTSVRAHLGDGWQPVDGLETWEVEWEVPVLFEDTAWALGALATTENASVYSVVTGRAWINVIISRHHVRILAPTDGAEVTRGLNTTITGTSTALLPATLDSVVVAVLDQRLPVSGNLRNWSVDWFVPIGSDQIQADIVAWSYAGGDSVSARVQVTVVPAGP